LFLVFVFLPREKARWKEHRQPVRIESSRMKQRS